MGELPERLGSPESNLRSNEMSFFVPYVFSNGRSDTPIPTNPILLLKLADFVSDDGSIFIGPHLMSDTEIDEFVNSLIQNAESFRRLAKHELELAKSRPPR